MDKGFSSEIYILLCLDPGLCCETKFFSQKLLPLSIHIDFCLFSLPSARWWVLSLVCYLSGLKRKMRGLHNLSNSADIMHLGNLMLRPTDLPFVTRIWGKHTIRRFEDNFHHQRKYIGYKFMNLNFSWTYFKIFYLWISSRISNSIEIYIKLKKKYLSNRALAVIFLTFLFCLLFIRHHDCELSFSSSLNPKLRCFIWCFSRRAASHYSTP